MKTSNFASDWNNPKAVSIERYHPKGWEGRIYMALAPPPFLLEYRDELTEKEFIREYYKHVLSRLNPRTVVQELGIDAVLLCYERHGEFCHRKIVAEWLFQSLDIYVPEIGSVKTNEPDIAQTTLY